MLTEILVLCKLMDGIENYCGVAKRCIRLIIIVVRFYSAIGIVAR